MAERAAEWHDSAGTYRHRQTPPPDWQQRASPTARCVQERRSMPGATAPQPEQPFLGGCCVGKLVARLGGALSRSILTYSASSSVRFVAFLLVNDWQALCASRRCHDSWAAVALLQASVHGVRVVQSQAQALVLWYDTERLTLDVLPSAYAFAGVVSSFSGILHFPLRRLRVEALDFLRHRRLLLRLSWLVAAFAGVLLARIPEIV